MIASGTSMRSIVTITSIDASDRASSSSGWEDRRRISITGPVARQPSLCPGRPLVCPLDNPERSVGNETIQKPLSLTLHFVEEEVVQFHFGINELEVDQQIHVLGLQKGCQSSCHLATELG